MKLSSQAISEYQKIHLAEFGEELSLDEAEDQANRTFQFLTHIFNQNHDQKSLQST